MENQTTKKLLYKIARAYYEEGKTQKQIGKCFGLSRVKVCRLLRQARDLKIVQVSFIDPEGSNADIEHQLATKYNINEVLTATPSTRHPQTIRATIGSVAANYLLRCIQGNECIAVTWGNTLLSVVDALPPRNYPNLRIIQSLGGLSQPNSDVNGADIVRRMAQTLGSKPILLFAPGLVGKKEIRDALIADPQISSVLEIAAKAQIAIVGIGAINPSSTLISHNIFSENDIKRIIQKGAIGDIGLRFFNQNGLPIEDEVDDRIIGLTLQQLKKISRVIGVAAGPEKIPAIRACLKSRLIDVLITDDQTAYTLLKETGG